MAESIRIAGIMRESIVDGPGIRFAVFCQGCPHDCPGCHNPETHDFAGGTEVSVERLLQEFDKDPLLAGATFSGGEPMCQAEGFAAFGRGIKERGKTITIYSGYTLEQLLAKAREDGPFVKAKRDLTLKFRGSSNQRLIDMQKTWKEGRLVLWEE